MSMFLVDSGDRVLSLLLIDEMVLLENNCLGCGALFFFGNTVISLSEMKVTDTEN